MLVKSDPEEIHSFLIDASYVNVGNAERVVFPTNADEVATVLKAATENKTAVTVSGAGTGTVAGRVPFGGIVLSTEKLNRIGSITAGSDGGHAVAQAGVVLSDLQRAVESKGLLYAPDPTERSCFLGGNIATNASGSRTFKYGPTRNYVERLQIALATGEVLDLRRGEIHADSNGRIKLPVASSRTIELSLPSYHMPHVRKHAAGYFVAPGMDALDLFIGSEGTLGVIVEAQLRLLPRPSGLLSGVVFFKSRESLLAFVREARTVSLSTRESSAAEVMIDARALEYFDDQSLDFLRQKYESIPADAVGAVFFEQETTETTEERLMTEWLSLLERNDALTESSWFATNENDQGRLREFRHQLPVLMNEWFARYNQRKVSTDMAVPDAQFPEMFRFYDELLRPSSLRYTIFGHVGDNHVHVNILPRDNSEAAKAWEIYRQFVRRAVEIGGTVSAEHGIGKLKREYLIELYGEDHVREMASLKLALDPAGILGRGNIFSEEYLA